MSLSLKDNKSIAPFMGEPKLPSLGLNPLGFRTASEQLFTALLPGLNVVTLRIRYYSFYCWLLQNFYTQRDKADVKEFRRHIRMSELLMALIHANSSDSMGVPGTTRAFEILERKGERLSFTEDAMPDGKYTGGYWKGVNGALGTYYSASLQEIGLILPLNRNEYLYNITKFSEDFISGEQLANEFEESIGKKLSQQFQDCSNKGVVTRDQLKELEGGFQTHKMPTNEECITLEKLLLQADKPRSEEQTFMRRNTIALLLHYINENKYDIFSELDFARYAYQQFKYGKNPNEATLGWFDYYLNDSRQFEALNLFDEVLAKLLKSDKPGRWENINEFTSNTAAEICSNWEKPSIRLEDLFANWNQVNEPENIMAKSFYRFFDDYINNSDYEEFKGKIKATYRGVHNDAIDFFDTIKSCIEYQLFDFVKSFLTEQIIYGHYSEAMRKFSQNGIATQKLMIENGFVKGLDRYGSSHSSPRINTLYNFVTDLGLVSNNKLTGRGKNLLKNLEE